MLTKLATDIPDVAVLKEFSCRLVFKYLIPLVIVNVKTRRISKYAGVLCCPNVFQINSSLSPR